MSRPTVSPFGDRAVLVAWRAEGFDADANARALNLARALRASGHFTEAVPGYHDVLAEFDPTRASLEDAMARINALLPSIPATPPKGREHILTVTYGGDAGPDLAAVAKAAGLSPTEVIRRHTARAYRVCTTGFIPGFAFLSDVEAALQHPRHASPRAHVPAGSVGIAGWQTGIYGQDSPGGWQIIGRTDAVMFDARRDTPFLVQAGDTIRFTPKGKGA